MVYLIHFRDKLGHAQHYVGWCRSIETHSRRIKHHLRGSGAYIMRAVSEARIPWAVATTWPDGDHVLEKWIKKQKNSKRFCAICAGTYVGEPDWKER